MIINVNSTFAPVQIHFSRLYCELNKFFRLKFSWLVIVRSQNRKRTITPSGDRHICHFNAWHRNRNTATYGSQLVLSARTQHVPPVLQRDRGQILPFGRPLQTMLLCCCPKRLMFYLRPHLKDLSVTLIKARGECLGVFSVNPKALCPCQPRFIGKKSGYICSRNLLPDPTSWCQLIICPLNLIRFSCAKTAGMENRALRTSTRSLAVTARIDKAHARRLARAHAQTQAQAGAVSARRSVCKIRHSIHLLVLCPATTVTLPYSGDLPTQTCQSRCSDSVFLIWFGVPAWLFLLRPHLTFRSFPAPPPPSHWTLPAALTWL